MRVSMAIAVALGCMVCGCASRETTCPLDSAVGPFCWSGTLLFDRTPGALPAGLFAERSDWPSAIRDSSTGEVEVYDVIIYDRQAGNSHYFGYGYDNYHRTFRSRRSGATFR